MTFRLEIDVTAPAAEAFAFVADFTTTPRWYSAVQRVEHVRGSGGLGTQYSVHRALPTGPAVNLVEVTGYVEGQEITFTSVTGPTPFSYRYRILPAPLGARLVLEGSISADGLPGIARLLSPVAERLFKRGMQDNLGALRALLQRS